MDPATAMLIATAVSEASKAYGAGSKRKENKRETAADMLNNSLDSSRELQRTRSSSRAKKGKRKAESFQETADLVRGAFNI